MNLPRSSAVLISTCLRALRRPCSARRATPVNLPYRSASSTSPKVPRSHSDERSSPRRSKPQSRPHTDDKGQGKPFGRPFGVRPPPDDNFSSNFSSSASTSKPFRPDRPPSRSTKPARVQLDPSALPPLKGPRVLFSGIHHDSVLPSFFRSSHINSVRTSSFTIRTLPSASLPVYRPPFPEPRDPAATPSSSPSSSSKNLTGHPSHNKSQDDEPPTDVLGYIHSQKRHPSSAVIRFGVVATKTNVSKFAVERNRVRNRFKAAVGMVVNRLSSTDGPLLSPDITYLGMINRSAYETPFEDLCKEVRTALAKLSKMSEGQSGDQGGFKRGNQAPRYGKAARKPPYKSAAR